MSLRVTLKGLPQTYLCDHCHQQFPTPLHLKYHRSRVHSEYKPYVCRLCHKAFRRINYLQQHIKRYHDEESSFVCQVCDESFKSRAQLTTHHRSHVHFEGHHECSYCGASFLHLAEARLHVLLVHNDTSVLPPDRPPRVFNESAMNGDVFCVKEGEGLILKLKRKLSTDGQYEQTTDDLNPGSHASDSGKGNSDMDEEDVLRNGNQLLKMPTLVVKHNDQTITTTQHRLNHDSSLLMKPKLELEQTQWGASKNQPRLDSSDFLSKTNFANSGSLKSAVAGSSFTSKLTPPSGTFGSPSHSGSFSSGMLNDCGLNMASADFKPAAFQSPPHSSPNVGLPGTTGGLFNSKATLLTNSTLGFSSSSNGGLNSKTSFMSNGPLNGTIFKAPTGVSTFGQPTAFGSKTQSGLFSCKSASSFGQTASPSGFGQKASASSFGQKASTSGFGQKASASSFGQKASASSFGQKASASSFGQKASASSFGQKVPSFGMGKFGMAAPLNNMVTTPFQPLQSRSRNGELEHEPVFGSREKVRNTVATKEEKEKPSSAFEQYAGSTGASTSNPFAEAMKKAKNPSPRRRADSDIFDDSNSSYYTDSETEDSEGSSEYTDEDEEVSLGDEVQPMSAESAQPLISDDAVSVPGELGSTPLQPWTSPHKLSKSPLKPLMSPAMSIASPKVNHIIGDLMEEPEPMHTTRKRKLSKSQTSSVPSTPSVPGSPAPSSLQPISPPASITRSKKAKKSNEIIESPASHRLRRRGSRSSSTKPIISPEHLLNKTPARVSPAAHQPNGDIGTEHTPLSVNEVSGHIDLESPSMSLSIPKVLLDQAADYKKKSKTRGRPKRTPTRPTRTPNPYTATPSYPASTPPYDSHTPMYSSSTPSYVAQTPAYFAPPTPCYPPATPQHIAQPPTLPPPPTPTYVPPPAPVTPSAPNRYNPRIHAPTKEQMMAKIMKKIRKPKRACIGPKSFLRKRGIKVRSGSEDELVDDPSMFHKSEFLPTLSGRTDRYAPYQSRFKQNQKYLCYLRYRACDLIISLFPELRFGGAFCTESDDVDGLIDYILTSLENQDSSSRCMRSLTSNRKELEIVLCRAGKSVIRHLERKLCKLLKLMLPSLSLQMIEKEGIKTLPALIDKVITENVS